MKSNTRTRREFLKESAATVAMMALPVSSRAATTLKTRMEWQQFKTTTHYAPFLSAIQTMRANTNSKNKNSWLYWVNAHVNYCPHGLPYFMAWHRGLLYYFEQQLRTISGDANLTIPYWDYYSNPNIPSEFLDTSSGNPLYQTRVNTNVYNALSLAPYAPTVVNFQTGLPNNFELGFEIAPHDPIHDIIGSYMADMTSPMDPIFWLHHSMVDRLWLAWTLAHPNRMPVSTNSYWSGTFTYASGLTIAKNLTINTTGLGYTYANTSMPTALPPQSRSNEVHIVRVQAQLEPLAAVPAVLSLATTPAATTLTNGTQSLGGVSNVTVTAGQSFSVKLKLPASGSKTVQGIVANHVATANALALQTTPNLASTATATATANTPNMVNIVLNKLSLPKGAAAGGFYCQLYLNLPPTAVSQEDRQKYLLADVGAFRINAALRMGMSKLSFPANDVLAATGTGGQTEWTITVIPITGAAKVKGKLIDIQELRIEVATPEASDM
jgi:tyrosinase